jgi:hypothetical protein
MNVGCEKLHSLYSAKILPGSSSEGGTNGHAARRGGMRNIYKFNRKTRNGR